MYSGASGTYQPGVTSATAPAPAAGPRRGGRRREPRDLPRAATPRQQILVSWRMQEERSVPAAAAKVAAAGERGPSRRCGGACCWLACHTIRNPSWYVFHLNVMPNNDADAWSPTKIAAGGYHVKTPHVALQVRLTQTLT